MSTSQTSTVVEQDHTLKLLENQGWDPRIEIIEVGAFVRSHIIYAQNFTLVYDTLLGPLSGGWLSSRVAERAGDKPIRVLVSHSDWDHCWGNQCFPLDVLYSHSLCAERMCGLVGRDELKMKQKEHQSYQLVQLVPPTRLLGEESIWDAGDLTVKILHTPGHRPDHLSLYIPEIATLLPGDAVETPFCLMDDENPKENLALIQDTLARLAALKTDWLLCNHALPQRGNDLVLQNLEHYRRLQVMATRAESVEELLVQFPYSGPSDQEFYEKDHARICRLAWQASHTLK